MSFIWYAVVLAQLFLIARLGQSGLYRHRLLFFAFHLTTVSQTAVLLPFDSATWLYAQVWAVTQPLVTGLQIAFVVTLLATVRRSFPGSELLVSRYMALILGAGVLVCFATASVEMGRLRWDIPNGIALMIAAKRMLSCVLACVLAATWAAVAFARPRLSRNDSRMLTITAAYCLSQALLPALRYFFPATLVPAWTQIPLLAASGVCYVAWTMCLTPGGEAAPSGSSSGVRLHWDGGEYERRMMALRSISVHVLARRAPHTLMSAMRVGRVRR